MRHFFIAAAASFALTAAACATAAYTMWGRSHADSQHAVSLHDLPAHHGRSLPLWIPG
jgi:hypothetical protein